MESKCAAYFRLSEHDLNLFLQVSKNSHKVAIGLCEVLVGDFIPLPLLVFEIAVKFDLRMKLKLSWQDGKLSSATHFCSLGNVATGAVSSFKSIYDSTH